MAFPSTSASPKSPSSSWAPKLARIAGIDVRMHITFPVLLIALAWMAWRPEGSLQAAVQELVFIVLLFGCVVLHEFGHALTARRFGCETEDITISPIGGVARLRSMPEKPSQELLVAFAGPAVNLVIAVLLWFGLSVWGGLSMPSELDEAQLKELAASLPLRLMVVNVMLAVFNLIPAFPMDGGRVLRALLAMRMDYLRATQIAARVGRVLALGLGFIGLQSNAILVVIAVFVWFGAGSETAAVETKRLMSGLRVRDAMVTKLNTIEVQQSLGSVVDLLLAGEQQDFPVVSDTGLVGLLCRDQLLAGLARGGADMRVGDAMTKAPETIEAGLSLETAMRDCQDAAQGRTVLVAERGVFVGMLTQENIRERLIVRELLAANEPRLSDGPASSSTGGQHLGVQH